MYENCTLYIFKPLAVLCSETLDSIDINGNYFDNSISMQELQTDLFAASQLWGFPAFLRVIWS